jgi:hypothetical protein
MPTKLNPKELARNIQKKSNPPAQCVPTDIERRLIEIEGFAARDAAHLVRVGADLENLKGTFGTLDRNVSAVMTKHAAQIHHLQSHGTQVTGAVQAQAQAVTGLIDEVAALTEANAQLGADVRTIGKWLPLAVIITIVFSVSAPYAINFLNSVNAPAKSGVTRAK